MDSPWWIIDALNRQEARMRSLNPTPYAVVCQRNIMGGPGCGKVYMDEEEYMAQLEGPFDKWRCPACGNDECVWDDDNYEARLNPSHDQT